MKKFLLLAVFTLVSSAYGQSGNFATPTRAVNGKLISLTNILGLSDCAVDDFSGQVKKVRKEPDALHFQLWNKTKSGKKHSSQMRMVDIRLDRVAPADRIALTHDLVKSGFVLHAAGYACRLQGVISAFTVDRVYRRVPVIQ
jgi:hypothetical protein